MPTSMGSEDLSGSNTTASSSMVGKTFSVVSSVTSTVFETGKSVGQAMGVVQQPRKGALHDPAFGEHQQTFGSAYNPPIGMQSMSSE